MRLTPAGATLLQERGVEVAESILDRLMRRHMALDHLWLILHAAALFTQAGYQVDTKPHLVQADLRLARDDQALYVECLREAGDPRALHAKWDALAAANGGTIAIVVQDTRAKGVARSAVNRWWYERGRPVVLVSVCALDQATPQQLWDVKPLGHQPT